MTQSEIFKNILLLLCNAVNVVGTIWAVLSILKMKPRDIYEATTYEEPLIADEALLQQKKQARCGVSSFVCAFVCQSVLSFMPVTFLKLFMVLLSVFIIVFILVLVVVHHLNRKFAEQYEEEKSRRISSGNVH